MSKAAFEMLLYVGKEKHKNYRGEEYRYEAEKLEECFVSDIQELGNSGLDFDCDFLEPFLESEEFKKLEPGYYWVFQYGDIHGESSYHYEYGYEFDGWIFEPEYTRTKKLKDEDCEDLKEENG